MKTRDSLVEFRQDGDNVGVVAVAVDLDSVRDVGQASTVA